MVSPVSPIVASLYIEAFEHRVIGMAVNSPSIWKRYVNDTFGIHQQTHRGEILQLINSVD